MQALATSDARAPVRRRYPTIERRSGLSREALARDYMARGRPVVIPTGASSWCARWAPAALRARFGESEILAEETREVYVGERALVRRSLGAVIDAALSGDARLRWKGLDFLARVPSMAEALAREPSPLADLIPESAHAVRSTLWLAPAATMSSLHHDGNFDNLNLQVSGTKHWVLIPPRQHESLYPHGSAESPLNPFAPDLRRFPRFARATPLEATLLPGDVLLVPKYWWHGVYAAEPSVNLATCFGWRGELSAWRALDGAPLAHRSLTTASASLKRLGLVRTANAARRAWALGHAHLVPRPEPQPR